MALEDMLLNDSQYTDDYFFFYIHEPSVIIGKHQNAMQEVNFPYAKEHSIHVSRRTSGGGAVYHDFGNLNYSFVLNKKLGELVDFAKYTAPIIKCLRELGVDAELSGRNDILIDGKKFSGTAQHLNKNKILSHGTLMFDLDIEAMANVLNVDGLKIESRAITSIRSRVANLKSYLADGMDIFAFKDAILKNLFEDSQIEVFELGNDDIGKIKKRVAEKFSTWEYNYGSFPPFSMAKKRKYGAGIIQANLDLREGAIGSVVFTGDFFANVPVEELQELLCGAAFNEESVRAAVGEQNVIAGLSTDELVDLLFY